MLDEPQESAAASAGGPSNERLRILQIMPTYYPAARYGGPIRSVHALATSLVKRGHEVHVLTSSMDGQNNLSVVEGKPTDVDGVSVRYFRVPILRRLCWCPGLLTALHAEAASFDVMHLHSVFLWPTYAAARVAHSVGLPFLVAPRGMLGKVVVQRKSRLVKSAWINLVEQRTLQDAAGLHVTSGLEAEEIRTLGLRLPQVFCVPNGLSWPKLHLPLHAGPYAALRKPYVLFLSRIDAKKGLDRLISAWQWVPDLRLMIAGNDEDGYERQLRKMATELGVAERIEFLGPVTDQHKWALYQNAMMFVLPSYSENFGNVVAEAMAMGCPVVVTPEVGLAGFVAETGCGLVSDGQPQTFAAAIIALSRDPARRLAMGNRGSQAAGQTLSKESVGQQMEQVYRRIIAKNPRIRSAP